LVFKLLVLTHFLLTLTLAGKMANHFQSVIMLRFALTAIFSEIKIENKLALSPAGVNHHFNFAKSG